MVLCTSVVRSVPGSSDGKESTCNVGDLGLIPGSGKCPGEENGNPLQCCLENFMDRGVWLTTVHGAAKSQTRLRDSHFHFYFCGVSCNFFLISDFVDLGPFPFFVDESAKGLPW